MKRRHVRARETRLRKNALSACRHSSRKIAATAAQVPGQNFWSLCLVFLFADLSDQLFCVREQVTVLAASVRRLLLNILYIINQLFVFFYFSRDGPHQSSDCEFCEVNALPTWPAAQLGAVEHSCASGSLLRCQPNDFVAEASLRSPQIFDEYVRRVPRKGL